MKRVKLVLSGSGTRFPVFVGALKRLEEEGYSFIEVIGTSGGSVIAAGLASGLSIKALEALCKQVMPKIGKLVNFSPLKLLNSKGLADSSALHDLLDKYFVSKLGQAKIPLHIVTTNFDNECKQIFSSKTHPTFDTSTVVRASMSIPVAFVPVEIQGDWYIDGGVFANFAIDYFGNEPDVIGLAFNRTTGRRKPRPNGWGGIVEFIMRIIDMLIIAKTNDDIEDIKLPNVINLDSKHDGMNFKITEANVDDMIKEGYSAVEKWLKTKK